MLYAREFQRNLKVCQKCGHHARITAAERIDLLADPDTWQELDAHLRPTDPIGFVRPGRESYAAKLAEEEQSSGLPDAAVYGHAAMDQIPVVLAIVDYHFFAATMGTVVGEKIARAAETARRQRQPLVAVAASGGARQDEGIYALLQMAKTTAALARLAEARLPFISILTDPTLAGVTASFASQGDCIIAEPGAIVGFAGPRLIQQIMREKLPDDADTAEFQLAHGMVDMITPRSSLKSVITQTLRLYLDALAAAESRPAVSGAPVVARALVDA